MVEETKIAEMPMSGMSSHRNESTYGDEIPEASLAKELEKMDT